MSVSPFSRERMENLVRDLNEISSRPFFQHSFYLNEERSNHHIYGVEANVRDDIARFVRNVYLANQMAYHITYDGDAEDWIVDNPQEWVRRTSIPPADLGAHYRELYDELGNIDYNCWSNGGNCFLPKRDQERIDRLRVFVAQQEMDLSREHVAYDGD